MQITPRKHFPLDLPTLLPTSFEVAATGKVIEQELSAITATPAIITNMFFITIDF